MTVSLNSLLFHHVLAFLFFMFLYINNIPKYGIAGGHPAKTFKYRDINHYEKLKKEGKFH